jgi:hypothetical protein
LTDYLLDTNVVFVFAGVAAISPWEARNPTS